MNVYQLDSENERKWVWFFTRRGLVLPMNSSEEQVFFDSHPRIPIERNPESTPLGSKARLSDYSNLAYSGYPIFSQRAREALEPVIGSLGRWIELDFDEGHYWLFWITNVVDALDETQSEIKRFEDGRIMRIASFVFKPEQVGDQYLFRLPQRHTSHGFATESFVELVRQHRLTGFSFHLLWSLERGPVSSKLKAWERPSITGLESGQTD